MSRPVKVKICGMTDLAAALAAAAAGADALGFVFAPSRRRVEPETARKIIAQLPPFIAKVGVFVNSPPAEIIKIAEYCGLTAVQLSGDEPSDFHPGGSLPIIRSIRMGGGKPVPELKQYRADAFIFDTYSKDSYGGTGKAFDWSLLKNINCPKPLLLAGGLNCKNVREAVTNVQPYAVDVSGGVETGGHKDTLKIKEFIALAKGV